MKGRQTGPEKKYFLLGSHVLSTGGYTQHIVHIPCILAAGVLAFANYVLCYEPFSELRDCADRVLEDIHCFGPSKEDGKSICSAQVNVCERVCCYNI